MKRKVSFILLITLLTVLLTGCMEFEVSIKLNKDNTGNINMLFAYNEETLGQYLSSEENPIQDFITLDDSIIEGVEVTTEEVQYTKNDLLYKGAKMTANYSDLGLLYNEMNSDDTFKFTELGNGIYRIEFTIEVDEELTGNELDSENMGFELTGDLFKEFGGRTEFIFETEYQITRHNANLITEDGKYIWDLSDAFMGIEESYIIVEYDTKQEASKDFTPAVLTKRQEVELKNGLDITDKDFHGKALQAIGILQGTDKGLELDRQLTRIEGAAMYARLLGFEDEINKFKTTNPTYVTGFNDIPKWAEPTINYLHYRGLVNGISTDEYGSNDYMTDQQFTTLVLRALGYNDGAGDFKWNNASAKAVEIGLYSNDSISYDSVITSQLTRRAMSYISYNALFFEHKTTGELLINNL